MTYAWLVSSSEIKLQKSAARKSEIKNLGMSLKKLGCAMTSPTDTSYSNLRYGFDPTNGNRHAWVENPILNHGVKWFPVRRYSWFPHSEIIDYCQDRQSAEELCNAINKLK
jgi:hypothetical protein